MYELEGTSDVPTGRRIDNAWALSILGTHWQVRGVDIDLCRRSDVLRVRRASIIHRRLASWSLCFPGTGSGASSSIGVERL